MVEIILPGRAFEQEGIPRFEKRAWAGLGIRQVLFLKLGKAFCLQYRDLTFVLHIAFSFILFPQCGRSYAGNSISSLVGSIVLTYQIMSLLLLVIISYDVSKVYKR